MNKRAPRRSDEEWHQIILAARSSGLNDFDYCRANGIPRSTFYRALARLRQQVCEIPARSERIECKQEVVPINISELPISREDRMHPMSITAFGDKSKDEIIEYLIDEHNVTERETAKLRQELAEAKEIIEEFKRMIFASRSEKKHVGYGKA